MKLLPWQGLVERWQGSIYLLPVIVACVVFALGALIRLPDWQQLQADEQARQAALELEHASKAGQVRALQQRQGELAEAERQLQGIQWQLAAGERMSDLLEQLAASGQALGLQFEQLEVLEVLPQSHYRQTPMDVQVVGRYPALRLWLEDWLGQLRLLRVEEMHWHGAPGKPGLIRLRLKVSAYQADAPLPAPSWLAQIPARAQFQPPALDPFAAWSGRAPQAGLGNVPLAQLVMVGSLSRRGEYEALLAYAGRLYRVHCGEQLGRDEGVVVRIDEQQVEVRERLFIAGEWHERTTFLALRKGADREASGDEKVGDRDVDAAGTGSVGAGSVL